MSTIQTRVTKFISENELEPSINDALFNLINGCVADLISHLKDTPVPEKSTTKTPKIEKLSDPTEAKSLDDLRDKCTSQVLNEFCKNNNLKVGGNKKEIAERVWRFIEGNSSDEDVSKKQKGKKTEKVIDKHECFACNGKGEPCGTAATESHENHWFCWRHIKFAQEFIDKKPNPENNEKKPNPENNEKEKKQVIKKPVKKQPAQLEESD